MAWTFDEIRAREREGIYKSKLPYPNQLPKTASETLRKGRIEAIEAYGKDDNRLIVEFTEDVISAIRASIQNIKPGGAEAIFSYAYQEGHSSGFSEVLNYAVEIVEVVKQCVG